MHLYQEQFAAEHDSPATLCAKVLVIASTPRCGSHMLGHALYSTGQFGFPLEYANPVNRKAWEARFGALGIAELMQQIMLHRTSANGVFAIKVHYEHLREFGGFQRFRELFPDAYYVVLARDDLLKQAVSLALAQQTGVWIAGQKPSGSAPRYDFARINSCLKNVTQQNAAWRYQLAAAGCRRLELCFESVAGDLTAAVGQVARFMDVAVDAGPAARGRRIATAPQSSGINGEWQRRFLEEFSGDELFAAGSSQSEAHSVWRRLRSSVESLARRG